MHGVEQSERLYRPIVQILLVALEGRAASYVDIPQIHRRMPVNDPVSEHPARPASGLNANGVESRRHKQPLDLRCLPQEVAVVRREALRTIEEELDTDRLQGRNTTDSGC